MARKRNIHTCAKCGESFNHGIGLRKHQRVSGHKGSKVEPAANREIASVVEPDKPTKKEQQRPTPPQSTPSTTPVEGEPQIRELAALPVYTGKAKGPRSTCLPPLL